MSGFRVGERCRVSGVPGVDWCEVLGVETPDSMPDLTAGLFAGPVRDILADWGVDTVLFLVGRLNCAESSDTVAFVLFHVAGVAAGEWCDGQSAADGRGGRIRVERAVYYASRN